MARQKKKEINSEEIVEKIPRTRSTKYSRTKGHNFETKIAKELRDLGYTGVVTARSESKSMDNNKIDLVDKNGIMPFFLQLKSTQNTPSYFSIEQACTDKTLPFCLLWSKQVKKEINICSVGEVVMIPKDFFYELLKKYSFE